MFAYICKRDTEMIQKKLISYLKLGGGVVEKNAFSLVNLPKSIPVENIKIKFSSKESKYIEAKKNSDF